MMPRSIIFLIAVIASGPVLSATAKLTEVTALKTLVDNTSYGACMLKISPGPQALLPGCQKDWVTFSCSGDFNSKSIGNLKFQSAQLALVTDKKLTLTIDNSRKHNGYCFARRVDVIK